MLHQVRLVCNSRAKRGLGLQGLIPSLLSMSLHVLRPGHPPLRVPRPGQPPPPDRGSPGETLSALLSPGEYWEPAADHQGHDALLTHLCSPGSSPPCRPLHRPGRENPECPERSSAWRKPGETRGDMGEWGAGRRGQGVSCSISVPRRGPAAVQVVHLAWVEQVVKLPKDPGNREA